MSDAGMLGKAIEAALRPWFTWCDDGISIVVSLGKRTVLGPLCEVFLRDVGRPVSADWVAGRPTEIRFGDLAVLYRVHVPTKQKLAEWQAKQDAALFCRAAT